MGADFQKYSKIFFKVDQIDFQSYSKSVKRPIQNQSWSKFLGRRQNFEKQAKKQKKAFLGTFWKILTKNNSVFLARAPPSKLVYIGAKYGYLKGGPLCR